MDEWECEFGRLTGKPCSGTVDHVYAPTGGGIAAICRDCAVSRRTAAMRPMTPEDRARMAAEEVLGS